MMQMFKIKLNETEFILGQYLHSSFYFVAVFKNILECSIRIGKS